MKGASPRWRSSFADRALQGSLRLPFSRGADRTYLSTRVLTTSKCSLYVLIP
jgi:hypothetical protein